VDVHLIAIKISIVGGADAFVEAESAMRHNFCAVSHDGDSVERGLTVEEYNVIVLQVPLNHVANP